VRYRAFGAGILSSIAEMTNLAGRLLKSTARSTQNLLRIICVVCMSTHYTGAKAEDWCLLKSSCTLTRLSLSLSLYLSLCLLGIHSEGKPNDLSSCACSQ